jgi:hypothetical protein
MSPVATLSPVVPLHGVQEQQLRSEYREDASVRAFEMA